ncbi:hypothetical protein DFH09DRAFT_1260851 [Mycena vulgaris]|nr:hypothetical protein DFH09DRAFT_1260851 [Mycena vulgaris]
MPVTFSVANHHAKSVDVYPPEGLTGEEILRNGCTPGQLRKEKVLQFGLSDPMSNEQGSRRDFKSKITGIVPNHNGFVNTVIEAYSQHHALVIRPDDVWLAILSQFNFFVNANAEVLRPSFVAYADKKHLVVEAAATLETVDFGDMAHQMVDLVDKNVVDPTLREWVLPNFTTTTANDIAVSAVLVMATLKQYFSYEFRLRCGIPRVTLQGEKSDWENILGRLEKLKEYGIETIAWYHLLRPVISRFVAAFDAPESQDNVDFWQKVAHEGGGSGTNYYSGWIDAFNVFSSKGTWLGHTLQSLSTERFWATYAKESDKQTDRSDLVLDGTPFHRVDRNDVPQGFATVDVKVDANGKIFDCVMTAGMIGMRVSSSNDLALSSNGTNDTVQPVAGWWIYVEK